MLAFTHVPKELWHKIRVSWHPPGAIDPERRGRINRYRRPPELLRRPEPRRQPTLAQQIATRRPGAVTGPSG